MCLTTELPIYVQVVVGDLTDRGQISTVPCGAVCYAFHANYMGDVDHPFRKEVDETLRQEFGMHQKARPSDLVTCGVEVYDKECSLKRVISTIAVEEWYENEIDRWDEYS